MGYFISVWGKCIVLPRMAAGHRRLFNAVAAKHEEWSGCWRVSDTPEGSCLSWEDNGRKTRPNQESLVKLIKTYLAPWGYKLGGEFVYQGEHDDDAGKLIIRDHAVSFRKESRWWR